MNYYISDLHIGHENVLKQDGKIRIMFHDIIMIDD